MSNNYYLLIVFPLFLLFGMQISRTKKWRGFMFVQYVFHFYIFSIIQKYLMLSSWWLYDGRKDSKKFIGHRNDKTLVLCLPPTVCGRVCKWVMLLVNYHVPSWMWPGDILPWNFWNVVNCNNMHTSIPSMENLFSYLKQ